MKGPPVDETLKCLDAQPFFVRSTSDKEAADKPGGNCSFTCLPTEGQVRVPIGRKVSLLHQSDGGRGMRGDRFGRG